MLLVWFPSSSCLPIHAIHCRCLWLPWYIQLMEAGPKVSVMPVVEEGKLVGLITLHALVSAGL